MNAIETSPLVPFLKPNHQIDFLRQVPTDLIRNPTPELQANQHFFDTPQWAKNYFEACHRSAAFRERWLAAIGSWDDQIVVDIGCGPGNLYATLGGHPQLIIGVDVAAASLEMAQSLGYVPLLADAHDLPLKSEFADIVTLNATLHHCKDMQQVLQEAARLVRPGGLLVVDHDPQQYAWNYQGLGMAFYRLRHLIYRYFLPSLDMEKEERRHALATEIHHHPGGGVTAELFIKTLLPRGFSLNLYPHNQTVGAAVLEGCIGHPPHWRYRLGQRLSGLNPELPEAALSLMCIARRNPL
ncbi:class I SAM-dependent methyltransferase [Sphaerothrix gracilis]|uniref:class I SAM-dependent methyltransferase n=1 Tax=Sphaerothrix gracilis TaxID=3151835 RepID=UPI0031FCF7CD